MDGMIGGYRIVRQLGQGGMGTVWLAEDSGGRRVALKVINSGLAGEPEFRDRFRQEVEAARRVRRFCTAPVLDAGLEGEPLWVATDFIDGPTLADAVSRNGPLRGADLEALAVGIATALTAIHEARLIHRDLKPANVLLSPTGPRVIDFGIARALDAAGQLTLPGTAIGTPGYIAPELLTGGQPLPAADVFSWGAVVAYAGTGRHPFGGPTRSEINDRVMRASPDLAGLDPQLSQIVARALDKDPAARPAVPDLLAALTGSPGSRTDLAPGPVPGPGPWEDPGGGTRPLPTQTAAGYWQGPDTPIAPDSAMPPGWRPRRRRRRWVPYAAVIGAVVLVAGAGTAYALESGEIASGSPGGPAPATSRPAPVPSAVAGSATASAAPPVAVSSAPAASPSAAASPITGTGWTTAGPDPSEEWLANSDSGSQLCLATPQGTADGASVMASDCENGSSASTELWNYSTTSQNMLNPPSGLCLDTNAAPAQGVQVILNPCGSSSGQLWNYDTSTGRFINTASGLCLDTDGNPSVGIDLVLDPCGNYSGQDWEWYTF